LRARVAECLRQWRPKLVEGGYQEVVFEDAMDVLLELLVRVATHENAITLEEWEGVVREGGASRLPCRGLRCGLARVLLGFCRGSRRQACCAHCSLGFSLFVGVLP
jgi:hypothetical protein